MSNRDHYAVIGNPIAHSRSPDIHALFAEQTGQAMVYDRILAEPGTFDEEVSAFFALGGKGLNVTVPFKEDAFHYVDELSARAKLAGAVNTLILQDDGCTAGDNTDGAGLLADLGRLGWDVAGKTVLLLGAGGASRGVLQPLLEAAPARLVVANRTVSKAQHLADVFAACGAVEACGFDDLAGQQFDLIINGTSASLAGEMPDLPAGILPVHACVYDMMYSREPTKFLVWAQEQGVSNCSDGLGMLVEQAAESFYRWRAVRPDTRPALEALRLALHRA